MHSALFVTMLTLTVLPGCADLSYFGNGVAGAVARPDPGLLPPVANTVTPTAEKLHSLPPPTAPVAVAVYGYGDQTGQMKPIANGANVQSLSRAVTQGATSVLIKALQDAGNGRWFTVVERERLDNLLKERRIIADMRQRYLGEQEVNPQALPPLLFAGVLLDGGIIGYDSNTLTGGAGANYLGIGGDANYSEDTVTVYLRGTSVKTGEVLLSVVATKKILSYGIDANAFRYVTYNRILQAEVGVTHNEPGSLAVEQAIEEAVLQFIVEGSARKLWAFKDKGFQSDIIRDYELNYLAVAKAEATDTTGEGKPAAANGKNGGTAVAAHGKPSAPVAAAKPGAAQGQAALAPVPAQPQVMLFAQLNGPNAAPQPQWATAVSSPQKVASAAAPGQTQQPQAGAPQQPAPLPFVIKKQTLEDEVPIAPR